MEGPWIELLFYWEGEFRANGVARPPPRPYLLSDVIPNRGAAEGEPAFRRQRRNCRQAAGHLTSKVVRDVKPLATLGIKGNREQATRQSLEQIRIAPANPQTADPHETHPTWDHK
jgi:hypothetical protein